MFVRNMQKTCWLLCSVWVQLLYSECANSLLQNVFLVIMAGNISFYRWFEHLLLTSDFSLVQTLSIASKCQVAWSSSKYTSDNGTSSLYVWLLAKIVSKPYEVMPQSQSWIVEDSTGKSLQLIERFLRSTTYFLMKQERKMQEQSMNNNNKKYYYMFEIFEK